MPCQHVSPLNGPLGSCGLSVALAGDVLAPCMVVSAALLTFVQPLDFIEIPKLLCEQCERHAVVRCVG